MELYPVVIPALKVTHSDQTYTCSGNGLQVFGCSFHSDVASQLQALEPARTPTGRIAKRQPKVPMYARHGINWWKAQCIFRGLPYKGMALKLLQDSLRDAAGKKRLPELAEMEKRLNREFIIKNAAAREEKSQRESGKSWKQIKAEREQAEQNRVKQLMEAERVRAEQRIKEEWKTLSTDQKAEKYPMRFLEEAFPPDGPETEAMVLKSISSYPRHQLKSDAKGFGLCTESIDASNIFECNDVEGLDDNLENLDEDSQISNDDSDRWIVIGRKSQYVAAKIQEIKQELLLARQQLHAAQEEDVRRGLGWDVTGSWRVKYRDLEDTYREGKLTIDIFRERSAGNLQIYGRFDFKVIKGVLRFEKPGAEEPVFDRLKARTQTEWDEFEDEEEGEVDDENFQLGPADKPSPQNPTWNFRWRGKDTGTGEIQLYSEEKLCSMTFSGPGGCKLTGTFHNEFLDNCEFSGVKVSAKARTSRLNIREEWQGHNENAYERARVRRWH